MFGAARFRLPTVAPPAPLPVPQKAIVKAAPLVLDHEIVDDEDEIELCSAEMVITQAFNDESASEVEESEDELEAPLSPILTPALKAPVTPSRSLSSVRFSMSKGATIPASPSSRSAQGLASQIRLPPSAPAVPLNDSPTRKRRRVRGAFAAMLDKVVGEAISNRAITKQYLAGTLASGLDNPAQILFQVTSVVKEGANALALCHPMDAPHTVHRVCMVDGAASEIFEGCRLLIVEPWNEIPCEDTSQFFVCRNFRVYAMGETTGKCPTRPPVLLRPLCGPLVCAPLME